MKVAEKDSGSYIPIRKGMMWSYRQYYKDELDVIKDNGHMTYGHGHK
jgi:hypothetical protein